MYNAKYSKYRVSPVHWSKKNGVHADYNPRGFKKSHIHIPYIGQTTLDVFIKPSYQNDLKLKKLGGTLKGY